MAVSVKKEIVATVTITMDGETATLLRRYLDPTDEFIYIRNEPKLKELLTALSMTPL